MRTNSQDSNYQTSSPRLFPELASMNIALYCTCPSAPRQPTVACSAARSLSCKLPVQVSHGHPTISALGRATFGYLGPISSAPGCAASRLCDGVQSKHGWEQYVAFFRVFVWVPWRPRGCHGTQAITPKLQTRCSPPCLDSAQCPRRRSPASRAGHPQCLALTLRGHCAGVSPDIARTSAQKL